MSGLKKCSGHCSWVRDNISFTISIRQRKRKAGCNHFWLKFFTNSFWLLLALSGNLQPSTVPTVARGRLSAFISVRPLVERNFVRARHSFFSHRIVALGPGESSTRICNNIFLAVGLVLNEHVTEPNTSVHLGRSTGIVVPVNGLARPHGKAAVAIQHPRWWGKVQTKPCEAAEGLHSMWLGIRVEPVASLRGAPGTSP